MLYYPVVVASFGDNKVLCGLVNHTCRKHVGRYKRGGCSLLCCDQNNSCTGCRVPCTVQFFIQLAVVVVVVSGTGTVVGFPGEAWCVCHGELGTTAVDLSGPRAYLETILNLP